MEQLKIPADARRCNDHIDGLVIGYAFGAKSALVARSLRTEWHLVKRHVFSPFGYKTCRGAEYLSCGDVADSAAGKVWGGA